MAGEEATTSSSWTRDEDKLFENALALALLPEGGNVRWEEIAAAVPGKSVEDTKMHYQLLMEDINAIESGRVPVPRYADDDEDGTEEGGEKGSHGSTLEQKHWKWIPWTKEEHKQFLRGLQEFGTGHWQSISRKYVPSRTHKQVASHAQKYFLRRNTINKGKRRSSIHDINIVDIGDVSKTQVPITGQSDASGVTTGTTMGRPVAGPHVQSVGTHVTLPHNAYGVRVPPSGAIVPGAPVGLPPIVGDKLHTHSTHTQMEWGKRR